MHGGRCYSGAEELFVNVEARAPPNVPTRVTVYLVVRANRSSIDIIG